MIAQDGYILAMNLIILGVGTTPIRKYGARHNHTWGQLC